MPTYAYSCTKCSEEFEVYQTFSDKPLKRHPGCGGSVQKVFKGVGRHEEVHLILAEISPMPPVVRN